MLDAGCWMLGAEHLHACTLELFLASWLPGFPGSHPISRATNDQAALHRPHCPRTCWDSGSVVGAAGRGTVGTWIACSLVHFRPGFLQVWALDQGLCSHQGSPQVASPHSMPLVVCRLQTADCSGNSSDHAPRRLGRCGPDGWKLGRAAVEATLLHAPPILFPKAGVPWTHYCATTTLQIQYCARSRSRSSPPTSHNPPN
jgi:hypothetical protein